MPQPVLSIKNLVFPRESHPYEGYIRSVDVYPNDRVTICNLDSSDLEVLLHIFTGRLLPLSGDVSLLGVLTRDFRDFESWSSTAQKLGLIDLKIPLLEEWPLLASLVQSHAMDLSCDLDESHIQRIRDEAVHFGVRQDDLEIPAVKTNPLNRLRIHFLRALTSRPQLLFILQRKNEWSSSLQKEFNRLLNSLKNPPTIVGLSAEPQKKSPWSTHFLQFDFVTGRARPSRRTVSIFQNLLP